MTGPLSTAPIWVGRLRPVVVLLFAWSLPVSLFGMQAGVVLGAVLLGAWALAVRGRGFAATPLDRAVLCMLAAVGASALFAPRGPTSFSTATTFWVCAAYYVTWFLLDTERTLRRALAGFVLLACLVSAFAVVQSLSGHYPLGRLIHPDVPVLLKPVPGMHGRVGGVGLFFSRLTLAHVLLFAFCWCVALALEPVRFRLRLAAGAAAAVTATGMLFTWTRATLVVAVGAAAVLALARLRGAWRKAAVVAGLLAVAAGALAASPVMRERLAKSFSGTRDWGRLAIWQTALDMASAEPLAGFGAGTYQRCARPFLMERTRQMGKDRFPAVIAWAHSNLLSFLAETGAVGAFAFCFLFVLYFRGVTRGLRRLADAPGDRDLLRGFVRGSAAGVGCFLLTGCFHDTFFDGEVVFTLWFAVAASLAAPRLAAPAGEEA